MLMSFQEENYSGLHVLWFASRGQICKLRDIVHVQLYCIFNPAILTDFFSTDQKNGYFLV